MSARINSEAKEITHPTNEKVQIPLKKRTNLDTTNQNSMLKLLAEEPTSVSVKSTATEGE